MSTELHDRRRWIALAVIVAAQFMVVLDIAIVNVALPSIKTDLHFTQESLQWVITAYSILFGGVLLLGGRMADLLGRRQQPGVIGPGRELRFQPAQSRLDRRSHVRCLLQQQERVSARRLGERQQLLYMRTDDDENVFDSRVSERGDDV